MDKATLQQLSYTDGFLGLWINKGPGVWEFMNFSPVKTDVKLNGKLADADELSRYGMEMKRAGKYAEAIGAYIRCMNAFYQKERQNIGFGCKRALQGARKRKLLQYGFYPCFDHSRRYATKPECRSRRNESL